MENPYPALVGEALGLKSVVNQGVSGATFCIVPDRTSMTNAILGFNGEADIISLLLGINDFTASYPLGKLGDKTGSTIYGCLDLISRHLTTNYPDALIFYMTPLQYKTQSNGSYRLEDVVTAIKKVAAKYDIPVLDLYDQGKYELEMGIAPNDGVHPSANHHREYLAPLVEKFIIEHTK